MPEAAGTTATSTLRAALRKRRIRYIAWQLGGVPISQCL